MSIPHHHHTRGGTPAVFPIFHVLVLSHLRPRDDEAPQVSEEPGATGDLHELAEFPCYDVVDASMVRRRGFGVFKIV